MVKPVDKERVVLDFILYSVLHIVWMPTKKMKKKQII